MGGFLQFCECVMQTYLKTAYWSDSFVQEFNTIFRLCVARVFSSRGNVFSQDLFTVYMDRIPEKKKRLRNTCSRIMSKGCCAIPWSCNHGILPLRELLQRANSDECFWPSRGKVHEYYVSSFKINIASARVSGTAVCFKIT